jgi:hypothetical protein
MVRLVRRISAVLLLASPLVMGCGESSKSTRDANALDAVTNADTGTKPDTSGDTAVPSDTTPALPDAGGDQAPSLDTKPVNPDVAVDAPAGDGAVDRAAADTGSSDSGATD